MFYCWVKQQNNNNMVDVIITCQYRHKILYTIGLGFMLILGLQGLPSGPKNCIQPSYCLWSEAKLCGLIPTIFLRSNLLGSTPTLLIVLPGVREILGLPLSHCKQLCCLPRQSEFPLMLQLRLSPFTKSGWGLTYTNKIREAQVLLAGSTMNTCLKKGEYKWAKKQIIIFMMHALSKGDQKEFRVLWHDSIYYVCYNIVSMFVYLMTNGPHCEISNYT